MKSKRPFLLQARTEIGLLEHLNAYIPDEQHNIVRLWLTFFLRNYPCLRGLYGPSFTEVGHHDLVNPLSAERTAERTRAMLAKARGGVYSQVTDDPLLWWPGGMG